MLDRAAAVLAIVIVSGSVCFAGPLEDGFAAYDRGDYAKARELWMPLAEQGDALAQFNIGILYELGHGAERNPAEAVLWYERAAEGGDVVSQFKLGLIYAEGQVVGQNYIEAAKWYLIAAENNHVRAQFSVGTLYANGQGVPQDLGLASRWYERAEETSCTFGDTAAALGPRLN